MWLTFEIAGLLYVFAGIVLLIFSIRHDSKSKRGRAFLASEWLGYSLFTLMFGPLIGIMVFSAILFGRLRR